jgi:hypothetical protein
MSIVDGRLPCVHVPLDATVAQDPRSGRQLEKRQKERKSKKSVCKKNHLVVRGSLIIGGSFRWSIT